MPARNLSGFTARLQPLIKITSGRIEKTVPERRASRVEARQRLSHQIVSRLDDLPSVDGATGRYDLRRLK
jgi:hypothetical protein